MRRPAPFQLVDSASCPAGPVFAGSAPGAPIRLDDGGWGERAFPCAPVRPLGVFPGGREGGAL